MTFALQASNLTKTWGSFVANSNVNLSIEKGARHALIGPNGAGKTTLVNVLSGAASPTSGSIFLDGAEITTMREDQRVKRGLARTYQINTLFPHLTVLETLMIALCERVGVSRRWLSSIDAFGDLRREANELLFRLRLHDVSNAVVGTLPYGKQRLIEIALGLALRPSVLILDEPAAGIPSGESTAVFSVIADLPNDITVVFIEHDMDLVFRFASRITVLVNGQVLTEGTPAEIASDPDVRQVYLGEASLGLPA
jgi:branched-chain amino acid transport system ATP-binding protein